MSLGALSSLDLSPTFEKAQSNLGATEALRPNASSFGLSTVNQNRPAPSVSVNLSSDTGAALNSSAEKNSPVYTRPVSDASSSTVSPAEINSRARQDNISDNTVDVSSNAGENQQDQTSGPSSAAAGNLTEQEMQIVDKLQARDREVRAHEQAHKAVGGQYAGAISFSYQSGPDGRRYAVGGEVPIDVSPIPGDPQATIAKMTIVKAAATAPAQPSTQDIMVAAEASRILMEAQNELMLEKAEDIEGDSQKQQEQVQSIESDSSDSDARDIEGSSSQAQTDLFQLISSLGSEMESRVDILI